MESLNSNMLYCINIARASSDIGHCVTKVKVTVGLEKFYHNVTNFRIKDKNQSKNNVHIAISILKGKK